MQEQLTAHALVADGVFLSSGTFRVLPLLPEEALCEALLHKVLNFLAEESVVSVDLAQRMRQWRHSGFSVNNRIRIKVADAERRQRLARYMIRCPFAPNKMNYERKSGMVIYGSNVHATLRRNYQRMLALKWLRLLMNHISDKCEHLVRYYDYYSNHSRGRSDRAQAGPRDVGTLTKVLPRLVGDRQSLGRPRTAMLSSRIVRSRR